MHKIAAYLDRLAAKQQTSDEELKFFIVIVTIVVAVLGAFVTHYGKNFRVAIGSADAEAESMVTEPRTGLVTDKNFRAYLMKLVVAPHRGPHIAEFLQIQGPRGAENREQNPEATEPQTPNPKGPQNREPAVAEEQAEGGSSAEFRSGSLAALLPLRNERAERFHQHLQPRRHLQKMSFQELVDYQRLSDLQTSSAV